MDWYTTIRPAIRPLHCGHDGDQGNYLAAPRSYISSSDPSRAHLCELVALEKRKDGQGSHGELERECPGSVLLGRASWCPVRLADVRISGSAVTRRFQIDGNPGTAETGQAAARRALDIVTARAFARSTPGALG
jgi:hypothetical protein